MAYTVKVTTKWADETLPIEQQIAKVRDLYMQDYVVNGFDPSAVTKLRREVSNNGDLLARGIIVSTDGTQIITTTVWRSQDAQAAYSEHPAMTAYLEAMERGGWSVTSAPVLKK